MGTYELARSGLVGLVADRPGSGKSTAARHLQLSYGFQSTAIGDAVKRELDSMLRVHGLKYNETTKERFRDGLIWWTTFRLRTDPDHWIRATLSTLTPGSPHVVSDVRFPDEADYIRALDGILIRIVRHSVPKHRGTTELAMDDYECEATVYNDRNDGGARMCDQLNTVLYQHGVLRQL